MRIVDLFCGCGGLSLGFSQAGFKPVAAYDYWDLAVETHNANFKHKAEKVDISNVTNTIEKLSKLSFQVVIGGPPCQDFSSAGNRKEGERADLTFSFAKIISHFQPTYFVMENVARTRNSGIYAKAREIYKEAGYGLTEKVIDASKCGVPQQRKRFFCIGAFGQEDGFLEDILESGFSEKKMTVRDYFDDELGVEHYYRHPRNYDRRGVFSIDEPAATIRGVNRPIPGGYKGHKNDSAKLSTKVRPLTTEERGQIQTFPKDFIWLGSKTNKEQMIGNAVPVELAKYVAKSLAKYHKIQQELEDKSA